MKKYSHFASLCYLSLQRKSLITNVKAELLEITFYYLKYENLSKARREKFRKIIYRV